MGTEKFSPESQRNNESTPVIVSNIPKVLTELQTMEPLQEAMKDITSIFNDTRYTPLVRTQLRIELESPEMQEKITSLLETGDMENINELLKNLVRNINNKRADEKVVRADEKVVRADEKNNQELDAIEINIKLAKIHIDAMYKSFGTKEQFQATFPEHQKWTEKATQDIIARNPSLKDKPDELQTQVQLKVLLDNRPAIEKGAQDKGIKIDESVYRNLENNAQTFDVSYSPKEFIPSTTPPHKDEKIQATFSKEEQSTISRRGDTLESTSPDGTRKVMDLKTGQVYMENSNGIRIPSKQEYQSSFEISANIQILKGEISNIGQEISREGAYLNRIATSILHPLDSMEKLDESSYDRILKGLGEQLKGTTKDTPDYDDINNLGQEIAKRKAKYLETGGLKEKQAKIPELTNKLQTLEESQKNGQERYQESLKSETEASRDNLKYLSSIGLDSLGQSGVDTIVKYINEKRRGQSGAGEIKLQKSFGGTEKKDFSQVIRDLIGTDPFIKDSIPPTLQPSITPQNIRGLLIGSGVLKTGEFQRVTFENKMRDKSTPKETQ